MRSYRLDLSLEHAAILRQWAGCARLVWNLALEQRMAAWEFNKHRTDDRRWKDQPCPNYVRQCQEVSALRAEHPWLAAAPAQVLQQKLRDLDTAFQRLFLGLAEHPVRKRKGHSTDSLRFPQADNRGWRRLSKHVGALRLPKLGWVRFRWSRQVVDIRLGERLRNVTLIHKPDGWHAVFCVELPAGAPPVPNSKPAGGVDRGCAVAVATSDGELLDVQPLTQCERQRYKRLQRKAARQQR